MFLYIWSIALMRPQCAKMQNDRTREQNMRRQFLHPKAVNNLSGANATQMWNMAKGQLSGAGLNFDTSYIDIGGKLASGDIAGAAGDSVTQMTGNQTLGTGVQVLADIVQTVIAKGAASVDAADKAQLANAKKQMDGTDKLAKTNLNAADEYTKVMLANLNSTVEGGISDINGMKSVIFDNSQKMRDILQQTKASNEDKQKQITDNEQKIKDNRAQMNVLLSQINTKKQEANLRVENRGKGDKPSTGNKDGITGQKGTPFLGDTGNSELDALIQQYNVLACDTEMLSALNTALTTEIKSSTEEASAQADEVIDVSDDQAADIDAKAIDILAEADNAQKAIGEIKNVLDGQFPKLDDATKIRIAGEIAKAGISGTESGLLAAAASAAGLTSTFSFGATASTAVELSKGSKNKAENVTANFAQASLEKTMQSLHKQMLNYTMNNLLDGLNLDANLKTQFMSTFDMAKNELMADKQENQKVADDTKTGVA